MIGLGCRFNHEPPGQRVQQHVPGHLVLDALGRAAPQASLHAGRQADCKISPASLDATEQAVNKIAAVHQHQVVSMELIEQRPGEGRLSLRPRRQGVAPGHPRQRELQHYHPRLHGPARLLVGGRAKMLGQAGMSRQVDRRAVGFPLLLVLLALGLVAATA